MTIRPLGLRLSVLYLVMLPPKTFEIHLTTEELFGPVFLYWYTEE